MKKYSKTISFIIVLAMMVALLAGCGETKQAEAAVNDTLAAIKALDFETLGDHLDVEDIMQSGESTSSLLDTDVLMKNLFGKLEYEILSSKKIDGSTVMVKTKITTVEIAPVLEEFLAEALDYLFSSILASPQPSDETISAELEKIFVECLSKEDAAKVTTEVDIKVVKVGNIWQVETSEELASALLGGYGQAVEDLNNTFGE